MVLTQIYDNVKNIPDLGQYHVETALVKSDDLAKKILRVTSDHGREYGIRLEDETAHLENGSCFVVGDHRLLAISVLPDRMIIIAPRSIDEMGQTAYMLGNLHKPLQVKEGTITLLYDEVVMQELDRKGIPCRVEKRTLDEALAYANFGHHHHGGQ
ncbi:MAG: urease accessory protein UreE [Lachnospiraceae bacterium]